MLLRTGAGYPSGEVPAQLELVLRWVRRVAASHPPVRSEIALRWRPLIFAAAKSSGDELVGQANALGIEGTAAAGNAIT